MGARELFACVGVVLVRDKALSLLFYVFFVGSRKEYLSWIESEEKLVNGRIQENVTWFNCWLPVVLTSQNCYSN